MNEKLGPLEQRTIKSFSVLLIVALVLFGVCAGIRHDIKQEGESPWLRSALEFNGRIWHRLFDSSKLAPEHEARPQGKKARLNGDLGLLSPLDLQAWQMDVDADHEDPANSHLKLTLKDLQQLPQTHSTIEFKCIEGWSEVISYSGVRFSDFLKHYHLNDQFAYVALETPDGQYYVSIDMKSMLHPQTLLAYEMNGVSLTPEHGAPLRLIIPVKYGIKSLKRIGKIYFSNQRPPDYWAERGYDWFAGL